MNGQYTLCECICIYKHLDIILYRRLYVKCYWKIWWYTPIWQIICCCKLLCRITEHWILLYIFFFFLLFILYFRFNIVCYGIEIDVWSYKYIKTLLSLTHLYNIREYIDVVRDSVLLRSHKYKCANVLNVWRNVDFDCYRHFIAIGKVG